MIFNAPYASFPSFFRWFRSRFYKQISIIIWPKPTQNTITYTINVITLCATHKNLL